jgi:hypothetical protein
MTGSALFNYVAAQFKEPQPLGLKAQGRLLDSRIKLCFNDTDRCIRTEGRHMYFSRVDIPDGLMLMAYSLRPRIDKLVYSSH